jgi:hypothetical protein
MDVRDTKQKSGSRDAAARPLARIAARELSPSEIAAVARGVCNTTRVTGPHGDDPSDPDWSA